jgi:predicted TIM-barrel fold metal-dependent hydrolase
MVEDTIESVLRMPISDADKDKILKKNAVEMLKFTL